MVISKFQGDYRFLSNFYSAAFFIGKYEYPSVEHYFQSEKTSDTAEKENIISASTAKQAKILGRKCKMRRNWNELRYDIMRKGVFEKFNQNRILKQKLLKMDYFLIEGNTWHDNTWGVCFCNNCPGYGQNLLGKILMEVRSILWSSSSS